MWVDKGEMPGEPRWWQYDARGDRRNTHAQTGAIGRGRRLAQGLSRRVLDTFSDADSADRKRKQQNEHTHKHAHSRQVRAGKRDSRERPKDKLLSG